MAGPGPDIHTLHLDGHHEMRQTNGFMEQNSREGGERNGQDLE